jgi:hypothetical protein
MDGLTWIFVIALALSVSALPDIVRIGKCFIE